MRIQKDGSINHEGIRIWCTPLLTIQSIIVFLGGTLFLFLIVLGAIQDRNIIISCLFTLLWLGLIASLWSLRREVFATLVLNQNGISFPSASKNHEFVSYTQYSHIYLGCYAHGFTEFPVKFIILSQRFLPRAQLNRANELSQSSAIVKIRFSKRNYKLLYKLLPPRQRIMLERECSRLVE